MSLSIIIPCYNEEKTLAGCVKSVLNLKKDDIELEIIIVDDKSKDNSLAGGFLRGCIEFNELSRL